jgi:hypothetical protein
MPRPADGQWRDVAPHGWALGRSGGYQCLGVASTSFPAAIRRPCRSSRQPSNGRD